MTITYCKKCITASTRPNIHFNKDGICDACVTAGQKKDINWAQRERDFCKVVETAKNKSKGYDCLIPVSGGKDSTWQVIKCLEYGLNPLCVTWKTPARTPIGERNLKNLVSLGVDHIDYQVSPKVEKKFMLATYEKLGSTGIPMHMALFNIPLNLASRMDIPLIIWGENSAYEYGGTEEDKKGFELTENWLKKYGVTHGTTASDWVSPSLSKKELTPYFGPSFKELKKKEIRAIFLGTYFPWDTETSLKAAQAHGFEVSTSVKTGYYNYADIDDNFISLHHYLKWYKFGFTRTYDNLSIEIRNGRLTRDDAIKILKERGDETPIDDIRLFCQFAGITEKRFFEIAETFRNKYIWQKVNNVWEIPGFLIKDYNWL